MTGPAVSRFRAFLLKLFVFFGRDRRVAMTDDELFGLVGRPTADAHEVPVLPAFAALINPASFVRAVADHRRCLVDLRLFLTVANQRPTTETDSASL